MVILKTDWDSPAHGRSKSGAGDAANPNTDPAGVRNPARACADGDRGEKKRARSWTETYFISMIACSEDIRCLCLTGTDGCSSRRLPFHYGEARFEPWITMSTSCPHTDLDQYRIGLLADPSLLVIVQMRIGWASGVVVIVRRPAIHDQIVNSPRHSTFGADTWDSAVVLVGSKLASDSELVVDWSRRMGERRLALMIDTILLDRIP